MDMHVRTSKEDTNKNMKAMLRHLARRSTGEIVCAVDIDYGGGSHSGMGRMLNSLAKKNICLERLPALVVSQKTGLEEVAYKVVGALPEGLIDVANDPNKGYKDWLTFISNKKKRRRYTNGNTPHADASRSEDLSSAAIEIDDDKILCPQCNGVGTVLIGADQKECYCCNGDKQVGMKRLSDRLDYWLTCQNKAKALPMIDLLNNAAIALHEKLKRNRNAKS